MTPLERAVRSVEQALIGHVDPETHVMSEYGIARMIVPMVLEAIREQSEAMVAAGDATDQMFGIDAPHADTPPALVWPAMIDALLEEGR